MNNNLTELVFILDRSGSMEGCEKQTINGFNNLINEQRKVEGKVLVSTLLFSTNIKILHNRVDIDKVKPLTYKDYQTDGCTALLDAVGKAIFHVSTLHKQLSKQNRPSKTIFVITTDGEENASKFYSFKKVKQMINCQKNRYGWEFLFLASDIDAEKCAGQIGISADRSLEYDKNTDTSVMFCSMSNAILSCRTTGSVNADWAKDLKHKKRKTKN